MIVSFACVVKPVPEQSVQVQKLRNQRDQDHGSRRRRASLTSRIALRKQKRCPRRPGTRSDNVVVVANRSSDDTARLSLSRFPVSLSTGRTESCRADRNASARTHWHAPCTPCAVLFGAETSISFVVHVASLRVLDMLSAVPLQEVSLSTQPVRAGFVDSLIGLRSKTIRRCVRRPKKAIRNRCERIDNVRTTAYEAAPAAFEARMWWASGVSVEDKGRHDRNSSEYGGRRCGHSHK
ncbi:hypothetical protein MRX96_043701 [Rhipicephalus microplus]